MHRRNAADDETGLSSSGSRGDEIDPRAAWECQSHRCKPNASSFGRAVQAVIEAIRIIVTQKERTACPDEATALNQEDAAYVYDGLLKGWALDGKPTAYAMKLEFELDQRDMGLKELPKPEQLFDFTLVDEVLTQKR